MEIKNIPDQELLAGSKRIFRGENELLLKQLRYFMEIERRRLYCAVQCGSLFQFAVKEIGYSEDQAQRRIAAMRLLKELPELAGAIETGELSLSNLGQARTLFKKRPCSRTEKLEILNQMINVSAREGAKIVAAIVPEALEHDRVRPVSADHSKFEFYGPSHLHEKLEALKGMLAHTDPEISTGDLMDRLCDLALETWSPATSRVRSRQKANSRAGVRRAIFKRDQVCSNCGSGYALEEDHIIPRTLGGGDEVGNLRVLCRQCNQRAAIEKLGQQKMDPFINSSRTT